MKISKTQWIKIHDIIYLKIKTYKNKTVEGIKTHKHKYTHPGTGIINKDIKTIVVMFKILKKFTDINTC